MSATAVAPVGAAPSGHRSSRKRIALRGLGEVLITFGLIIVLLVGYQLFWTNLEADRAQAGVKDDMRSSWAVSAGKKVKGDALGIMYIERLGRTWEKPLVEGVDLDRLALGVGHFPKSAMPGQIGNFSVAAHRATHGEPFAYLDRMQPKDKIVIETRDRWYVYTVDAQKGEAAHPAWKLVDPSYGSVVFPVPERPDVKPTKALITLVTCNPRWGSTTRLIVYGHLTKTYDKPGTLPAELAYTKG